MTLVQYLFWIAASWYLSYILVRSIGPFGLFVRAREWRKGRWHGRVYHPEYAVGRMNFEGESVQSGIKGGHLRFHGLFDCIICTLPYVAAIIRLGIAVALKQSFEPLMIVEIFGVSGIALWIHSASGWFNKS